MKTFGEILRKKQITKGQTKELKNRIFELEKENAKLKTKIPFQEVALNEKLKEIKKECLKKFEIDVALIKNNALKLFAEKLKKKVVCLKFSKENLNEKYIKQELTIKAIDKTLKECICEKFK